MSLKKSEQLGMNPSTASGRLIKDLLWNFINLQGMNTCHHCGKEMTRETFSIEHVIPWLDSEDPVGLYFDLDNIKFSHLACNCKAAKRSIPQHGTNYMYSNGCRCELCVKEKQKSNSLRTFCPEKRREKYLRTGK